jgi:hypothetical protein
VAAGPAAARIGGVGLQIVRDWGIRFNARGPDGLACAADGLLDELVGRYPSYEDLATIVRQRFA